MDKGFLTEAFKELKMLNEEDYNLNNKDEIEDMHDTVFNQLDDKSIDIIDPNAQSVDDLEDSYIGKVILDCDVCHSKIYKDPSEVVIDDESSLANIDEECPYCYSTDGYKIIGEVASYDGASLEDDADEEDEDDEDEHDEDNEDEDEEDEELTEAKNKHYRKKSYLKESQKSKSIKESYRFYGSNKTVKDYFNNVIVNAERVKDADIRFTNYLITDKGKLEIGFIKLPYETFPDDDAIIVIPSFDYQWIGDWDSALEVYDIITKKVSEIYDIQTFVNSISGDPSPEKVDKILRGLSKSKVVDLKESKSIKDDDEDSINESRKSKSIKESLQKGDYVRIQWKDPNWSTTSPCYASCTYLGRTNDGKYKFKSDTYGWIFIVDTTTNTVTTPQDKEFELYDNSGWTKIFNESKSIKEDEDSINEGILGKAAGGNLVGSTVGAGLGTALGSVAGVPGMIAGGIAGSALGGSAGSKLAAGSELLKDDIAPSKGQRKFKHLKSIDECNASNNSKSQLSNKIYKSKKANEGLKHLKKSFKKNVSESQCSQCDQVADILQNSTYPRGFRYLSGNGTAGEVQYNGVKYAFRKRNDGTYKVMTSADAGWNWSDTLYKESIEDINVNTTDGSVKVDQSEGNINISIEKNSLKDDKIIPVSSDVKDEIANNSEDDTIEFDDVDSQAFDELGESYLKKIYENVKSFKTTKSYQSGNKLVVEGKIKFTSNNVKPTQFIFENFNFNKSKEKLVMFGENAQISRGKKSFRLAGKLNENIFVPTSLRYAYSAKLDENKSQRITGHVKLNEAKAVDLSKVEGSMSNIIQSNMDKINNCKTKDELLSTIKKIFDENNLNTKASNRLLNNIARCKNFNNALMVVTNSYLSGTGNKVIK